MPSRDPPQALELHVFGVPVAFAGGREARLALKRAYALLAYLGFNEGPVPRAHLARMLWPDADETVGRTRLRRLIYAIDDVAGGPLFAGEGDSLALVAGRIEIDALGFAR